MGGGEEGAEKGHALDVVPVEVGDEDIGRPVPPGIKKGPLHGLKSGPAIHQQEPVFRLQGDARCVSAPADVIPPGDGSGTSGAKKSELQSIRRLTGPPTAKGGGPCFCRNPPENRR